MLLRCWDLEISSDLISIEVNLSLVWKFVSISYCSFCYLVKNVQLKQLTVIIEKKVTKVLADANCV